MNTLKILEEIGLNQKEARVYLSSLELGQDTAYNIAKASGLKRATVYFVLEGLLEKGLVSLRKTRKATYYSVISPDKLLAYLERKQEQLKNILPDLQQKYDQQPTKPIIHVFEGKEGLLQVYNEVTIYLNKSKEVLYYGSMQHWEQEGFETELDLWIQTMKNKRSIVREILSKNDPEAKKYAKRILANGNPNHRIRFLPDNLEYYDNDNMIYGDKIAIFSVGKSVFVTIIESKNIADSYRTLFNAAWNSSTTLK